MESQLHSYIRSMRNGGGQNLDAFQGQAETTKGKTFDGLKAKARAQRSESLTKDSLSYQKRKDQQRQGVAARRRREKTSKKKEQHAPLPR